MGTCPPKALCTSAQGSGMHKFELLKVALREGGGCVGDVASAWQVWEAFLQ